jgi:hypothetical protein
MKQSTIGLYGVILICFFLPWFKVSCGPIAMELSGFQLAAGSYAQQFEPQFGTANKRPRAESAWWLFLVPFACIAGIVGNSLPTRVRGLNSLLTLGCVSVSLGQYIYLINQIPPQQAVLIQVKALAAFWLTVVLSGLNFGLSFIPTPYKRGRSLSIKPPATGGKNSLESTIPAARLAALHRRTRQFAVIIGVLTATSLMISGQSVIRPAPTGCSLTGKLEYRVESPTSGGTASGTIADGHVFVLSSVDQTILAYGRTARGPGLAGKWQIDGLPCNEQVLLVGFSSSVHRLAWVEHVSMDGRSSRDLGTKFATLPVFKPGGPDSGLLSAPGSALQLLALVGWIAGEITTGLSTRDLDVLTERLLREVNQLDRSSEKSMKGLIAYYPFSGT